MQPSCVQFDWEIFNNLCVRGVVIYKIVFLLAGLYNIVFAVWLYLSPDTLFGLAGTTFPLPENYVLPLAVSIGGLAALYAVVIVRTEKFKRLIVLGLLSKVLPLISVSVMIIFFGWSPRLLLLIFFNDIIWWPSFIGFLKSQHVFSTSRNTS